MLGLTLALAVAGEARIGEPALWVDVRGEGAPTTILVHGGPGASHATVEPLADLLHGTVVLYDQRGAGRSDSPIDPDAWTFDDYVEDLERVREWTGASRIRVIGHSWGAMVGMAYAGAHPDHLDSLVLIGAGGPHLEALRRGWKRNRRRAQELVVEGAMPAPPASLDPSCVDWWDSVVATYHDPAAVGVDGFSSTCSLDANRRTWDAVGDYDLRPVLDGLSVPTLVVYGTADPFAAATSAMRGALPDARLEILPRCGHRPMFECPDALRALLDDFYGADEAPGSCGGGALGGASALLLVAWGACRSGRIRARLSTGRSPSIE